MFSFSLLLMMWTKSLDSENMVSVEVHFTLIDLLFPSAWNGYTFYFYVSSVIYRLHTSYKNGSLWGNDISFISDGDLLKFTQVVLASVVI